MEYGLIGEKLGHSFSALIHKELGGYEYKLVPTAKDSLKDLFAKREFKGINVTIPYKEAVMPYCDYICPEAREIGAVNTVINNAGKLWGYNTDYSGFNYLLDENMISVEGKNVLVLGTGGTCKTVCAVLKTKSPKSITAVSREGKFGAVTYSRAQTMLETNIIINTTPCGMYPDSDKQPMDLTCFPELECVVDAIYNPLRTHIVQCGTDMGCTAIGGLQMLVAQAYYASQLFLQHDIPLQEIDRIYRKILDEKSNIVLIGMPSCGKTTVGKTLASITNKKFLDIDDEIVSHTGETISKIFDSRGEAWFRKEEKQITKKLSAENGTVIATGGGVVKDEENMTYLRENGVVIYLDRPENMLIPSGDRPLFSNRKVLKALLAERVELYKKYSDITVINDGDPAAAAHAIKERYNETICNKRA